MKDAEIRELLNRLYESGQQHDAHEQEHSKRLRNLEPDTAQLLHILIRSTKRTRLLEIGTSNGYSTIWLAWAARETGGRIISIERDVHKQAQANENLRQAGLREVVDLVCGDANEVLATLPGPFDWVFFDGDRYDAPQQLALLVPKLTADAFVLADNVLSHPNEIAGYLKALEALPQFDRVIIPTGKGLSLAYQGVAISQS
jgi:predicted O-methyltransferase YrrM